MNNLYEYKSFKKKYKNPHGWIQWKGTDVCIDINCTCGRLLHYDGDFMYFVKCPYCERVFECDGHIELHELTTEEAELVEPKLLKKDI